VTAPAKARSGFSVDAVDGGELRVAEGRDFRLTARLGPVGVVREPVRVVAVADEPDRCGFAYGTLPEHEVCGEEAFVVARDEAALTGGTRVRAVGCGVGG
jgi:uncharacterized protein (UPF0548 family)